jgi:hypothetical protein
MQAGEFRRQANNNRLSLSYGYRCNQSKPAATKRSKSRLVRSRTTRRKLRDKKSGTPRGTCDFANTPNMTRPVLGREIP